MTDATALLRAGLTVDGRLRRLESIRLELAAAWGEMGAAWGVTPAIARVQAYLMARQAAHGTRGPRGARTQPSRRQPRPGRGRSWGIVERVPEPRRVGRRGPAEPRTSLSGITGSGSAGSSPNARCARGSDRRRPRGKVDGGYRRGPGAPGRYELAALRNWLAAFLVFVRLFDRAVGLLPQLEPRARTVTQPARPRPGRHHPALVRPARRPARRGHPRPGRDALAAFADSRTPRNEAHVGGRPHRRALGTQLRTESLQDWYQRNCPA